MVGCNPFELNLFDFFSSSTPYNSFLITADDGTKIITDPYATNERLKYGDIKESADVVVVSHEHGDHNNVAAVKGKPEVVKGRRN